MIFVWFIINKICKIYQYHSYIIIFVFIIILFQITSCTDCKLHDYIAITDPRLAWIDANDYCSSTYNSTLAIIETDGDFKNMQAVIALSSTPSYSFWIGLNDIYNFGTWTWIDGTPCDGGNCINSSYWRVNFPTNHDSKHCVYTDVSGWADWVCADEVGFLCENPNHIISGNKYIHITIFYV